jgi:hypothetical protein
MSTREDFLSEMRRIAKENNGVAPGLDKFKSESEGITGDWRKLWPRWSEFIKDAGLSPNEFGRAYTEDEILKKYAQVSRRLQKLPTYSELLIERTRDLDFPVPSVFDRWGGKAELVRRLCEFCASSEEFQDILNLCNSYRSPRGVVEIRQSSTLKADGFVYLLRAGKFHKIGATNSCGRREAELAIQLPEKSKIVHQIQTDDPFGIEKYWHERFADKRQNGEWFLLSADDVAAFKRRKKFM